MKTLFKPTSYKKGTALAIGATLVWKIISFANALLLALFFGANRQTDVYFYLIMLMGFGIAFLQRLNQTVLIPEAMFLRQENEKNARALVTMWLYIYIGLGILIAAVGIGWSEPLWGVLSRFGNHTLMHDQHLLVCGCILFALQIVMYYLNAVAEMYQFFKTVWLGILNALCPLVCLLVWGNQVGIISMIYGFLLAATVQILVLLVLLKTQLAWNFRPAWIMLRVRTRQNMLTGQTLAVLDMINGWLPVYLISGLGTGLVSALNYCRQFTDSTTEVFTSRAANIAKIQMTQQTAACEYDKANQTFLDTAHLLLIILAPLVVFSCYFAPQIVELFFKRGQFTQAAANDTVLFLRPMLFTLLLAVPGYLQNSAIAAGRKIKEGFPYALISAFFFTALAVWAIPHRGAFSYPYVIAAGLLVGFGLNAILFQKHFPFLDYAKQLWLVVRLTLWAGIALIPAIVAGNYLPQSCWIQILGCGPVFLLVYAVILCISKDSAQLTKFFTNGF